MDYSRYSMKNLSVSDVSRQIFGHVSPAIGRPSLGAFFQSAVQVESNAQQLCGAFGDAGADLKNAFGNDHAYDDFRNGVTLNQLGGPLRWWPAAVELNDAADRASKAQDFTEVVTSTEDTTVRALANSLTAAEKSRSDLAKAFLANISPLAKSVGELQRWPTIFQDSQAALRGRSIEQDVKYSYAMTKLKAALVAYIRKDIIALDVVQNAQEKFDRVSAAATAEPAPTADPNFKPVEFKGPGRALTVADYLAAKRAGGEEIAARMLAADKAVAVKRAADAAAAKALKDAADKTSADNTTDDLKFDHGLDNQKNSQALVVDEKPGVPSWVWVAGGAATIAVMFFALKK